MKDMCSKKLWDKSFKALAYDKQKDSITEGYWLSNTAVYHFWPFSLSAYFLQEKCCQK